MHRSSARCVVSATPSPGGCSGLPGIARTCAGTRIAAIIAEMRLIAVVMAGLLVGTGCAANSYRIPNSELQRLSMLPPEQRSQRVLVSQELTDTEVVPAQPVNSETEVVWIPDIHVSGGFSGGVHGGNASGVHTGGGGGFKGLSGGGSDGKAAAVAVLVIAAVILV